jgi:hypothetical protein
VKSLVAQMRVARSALEGWIRARLEPDHPSVAWLTEYVSMMLNKFEVGKDGMTA